MYGFSVDYNSIDKSDTLNINSLTICQKESFNLGCCVGPRFGDTSQESRLFDFDNLFYF